MRRFNKEKKYPSGVDIRIFTPGFIGHLDPDEYKFLKKELDKRSGLRKRWLFKDTAKRLSEFHIRHVAMYGVLHTDKCDCNGVLSGLKNDLGTNVEGGS